MKFGLATGAPNEGAEGVTLKLEFAGNGFSWKELVAGAVFFSLAAFALLLMKFANAFWGAGSGVVFPSSLEGFAFERFGYKLGVCDGRAALGVFIIDPNGFEEGVLSASLCELDSGC